PASKDHDGGKRRKAGSSTSSCTSKSYGRDMEQQVGNSPVHSDSDQTTHSPFPCKDAMTRLGESISRALGLLWQDLSSDELVEALLAESAVRRSLDLSDLGPVEQAELIAGRTVEVLPSVEGLS